MTEYRILTSAEDVDDSVLAHISATLDWFEDDRFLVTEDFIDRLCETYLNGDYKDIESYGCAAANKIMRVARREFRERKEMG